MTPAELLALAKKATQGQWYVEDHRKNGDWRSTGLIWARTEFPPGSLICRVDADKINEDNVEEFETKAQYIAAACPHNLIPILERLVKLEAVAEKMATALSVIQDHSQHDEVRIYDPTIFKDALAQWKAFKEGMK